MDASVSLEDRWTIETGRIVITGTQAIARILLAQKAFDTRAGLKTAGYVTGYRGSPLGAVDSALWSAADRLAAAGIVFQPGLNEDIAATAIRGTQQIEAVPGARHDGVFAAWYAKGPGVDRAGDAFKHGNYAGTHRHGGVLVFYGDDHAGKSSTVAHASEAAIAASSIPSLYPADVGELLAYGQLGFALSRYSGLWVGVKCVNEVAEQTATVDVDLPAFAPVLPPRADDVNIQPRAAFNPLGEERMVVERRLPLVHRFVRANGIDRIIIDSPRRGLGIVAAGKSYGDVRAALALLGLDENAAAAAGLSLYKPGCIWPLEPQGLTLFAEDQRALLVVEEKRAFIESQVASILYNLSGRPLLTGKADEEGAPLLSAAAPLDPTMIALAITGRLERLGLLSDSLRAARDALIPPTNPAGVPVPRRAPYFCSGCPHNRSTRIPDGSLSMTGIGCHTMINLVRPDIALLPTQMGGEGGNWLGLAPFTETPHIFQNMGDGTYYHSGLLAIRAAVAARVNITYKILYNDAVAMTGGQPVDGPLSVADIVRQVIAEGVARVVVLSDDPSRHRRAGLPEAVTIGHRDALETVQRELRETPGCTVLIYEQTCAAEKRRRRKRGTFPDPDQRLFIAKSVCEGCGDCSVQSTCVSLTPVETAFGRKRAIDQSSCNKDYSCVNGLCPSFLTVRGAAPRRPEAVALDEGLFDALPEPRRAPIDDGFSLMVAGIGGTGVVTVGAVIGMAAHLEGKAVSLFDMTGLSQKNGAVYSHVRLAAEPGRIFTQRVGRGEADLVLAFDMIAALAPEAADTVAAGRTRVLANADLSPTVAFQFDRDAAADPSALLARLRQSAGDGGVTAFDASAIALALLGDAIGANLFLVGHAAQSGWLPVGASAIEQAIRLNGVAVPFNLRAFRLGRLYAADPGKIQALRKPPAAALPTTLAEIVEHRTAHLAAYQNAGLAERYRALVERAAARERQISPGSELLARAVARNYAKLLAYKDEYEVARLLTHPDLREELAASFAKGARLSFNLAPPIFGGTAKREFGPWLRPGLALLARLRGLRGSWLDPFARTAERRMERRLIVDYERLVDRLLDRLDPRNLDAATRALSLADQVRGFGPVKMAAVEKYRRELAGIIETLDP
jgi:indolepyruvate ferredoxin oxidoreductase